MVAKMLQWHFVVTVFTHLFLAVEYCLEYRDRRIVLFYVCNLQISSDC